MTNAKKKLLLVFPPYAMATSPPLGVCVLKGRLEATLPMWSVKVLDLNLLAQEKLFDRLLAGPYLNRDAFPEGPLGEIALSRAAEVFRGANERDFYYRADRYSVYASLFERLLRHEMSNLGALEQGYFDSDRMPSLVKWLVEQIKAEQADAVGISLCYTQQVWWGLCMGKLIKQSGDVPVIFGGAFFNEFSENFLSDHRDALDYLIVGEGEKPLSLLFGGKTDLANIPGLSYFRENEVQENDPEFEHDLDSLGHPDFSDLDLQRYFSPHPVLPVLTCRGCYWRRCAFCIHYKSAGLTYRRHSPEHIIEELKSHADNGIRHFNFVDEMISPEHFRKLAQAIIAAKLDIKYYALAKPVKQFTPELLSFIKESGCQYLIWGVESGSQRMLDLMDKGTKVSDIAGVLQTSRQAGLFNHVFILFGFPTETKEDFAQTLRFLEENKNAIYGVNISSFNLNKGSPVFDNPERFSITRVWPTGDYRSHGGFGFSCSSGMSHEETGELIGKMRMFLGAFNPYSGAIQNFRDHALLIYGKVGAKLKPESRPLPKLVISLPEQSSFSA